MKLKFWLILSILFFSLQGCASYKTMRMSAVASPGQQTGYQETITSQKKHFVSLAPYREENQANGNTSFILYVRNFGENDIHIGIDSVAVIFDGNSVEWNSREITILSTEDLMSELIHKKRNEEMTAMGATQTRTYDIYDSNGQYLYTSTVTEHSRFYEISNLAIAEINRQMALVEELVLKPQTLLPGEGGGGLVVCETRSMDSKTEGNFRVVVTVDDEEHKFTFNRSQMTEGKRRD